MKNAEQLLPVLCVLRHWGQVAWRCEERIHAFTDKYDCARWLKENVIRKLPGQSVQVQCRGGLAVNDMVFNTDVQIRERQTPSAAYLASANKPYARWSELAWSSNRLVIVACLKPTVHTWPVCAGPMQTRSKVAWQCVKRSSKRPVEGSLTSCSLSSESSHSVSAFSHRLFDSRVLAV